MWKVAGSTRPSSTQTLGDLVHRVHHHRHGEEEVDAQPQLHGGRQPPAAEVGGDDVARGVAERDVPHDTEQPVHDSYERHGQPERGAELLLVRGLRLQRQDHTDALEGVHGHARTVEERGGGAERGDGWVRGEPSRHVLANNDPHGAEVDDVGEDAERRESVSVLMELSPSWNGSMA